MITQIAIKSRDKDNWHVYEEILTLLSAVISPNDYFSKYELVAAINELLPVLATLNKLDPTLVGYCAVTENMIFINDLVTLSCIKGDFNSRATYEEALEEALQYALAHVINQDTFHLSYDNTRTDTTRPN
jgi:hypothetical protein